jgi:hypothetical protein
MSVFLETIQLMGIGMIGVFISILIFYVLIVAMTKFL